MQGTHPEYLNQLRIYQSNCNASNDAQLIMLNALNPIDSLDITAIRIAGEFGHIRIFNIYNDCKHSRVLQCLEQFLLVPSHTPAVHSGDIWIGDFNRHDPMWEHPDNAQLFTRANIDAADYLIDLLADFGMDIVLELGIPTLEHLVSKALHCVDHIFCSHQLSSKFVRCEVLLHERPLKTDHFPIVSRVDLAMICMDEEPKCNF